MKTPELGDWVYVDVKELDGCEWPLSLKYQVGGQRTRAVPPNHVWVQVLHIRAPGYRSRKNARGSTAPILTVQCVPRTCHIGHQMADHHHTIRLDRVQNVCPSWWSITRVERFLLG